MTKEKVIEHLANIGGFDTSYSYGNMKSCIDQVFDYFEGKSCESCKFVKIDDFNNIYCDMFQCYQQKALKYCGNWEQK